MYDVEFLIFTSRKIIKETREIVVTVNPDYFFLVKDFADEFTKFPLKVGNSFNKYYTIDIYKFLRQYADTGVWAVTVEDFKKYLNIPEVYGATKIREKIIEPAIEELKPYYSELSFVEVYKRKKKVSVDVKRFRLIVSSLRKRKEISGKMTSLLRCKTRKQTSLSGQTRVQERDNRRRKG